MQVMLDMDNVDEEVITAEIEFWIEYLLGLIDDESLTIDEAVIVAGKTAEALALLHSGGRTQH